jgi:hypothetical protein
MDYCNTLNKLPQLPLGRSSPKGVKDNVQQPEQGNLTPRTIAQNQLVKCVKNLMPNELNPFQTKAITQQFIWLAQNVMVLKSCNLMENHTLAPLLNEFFRDFINTAQIKTNPSNSEKAKYLTQIKGFLVAVLTIAECSRSSYNQQLFDQQILVMDSFKSEHPLKIVRDCLINPSHDHNLITDHKLNEAILNRFPLYLIDDALNLALSEPKASIYTDDYLDTPVYTKSNGINAFFPTEAMTEISDACCYLFKHITSYPRLERHFLKVNQSAEKPALANRLALLTKQLGNNVREGKLTSLGDSHLTAQLTYYIIYTILGKHLLTDEKVTNDSESTEERIGNLMVKLDEIMADMHIYQLPKSKHCFVAYGDISTENSIIFDCALPYLGQLGILHKELKGEKLPYQVSMCPIITGHNSYLTMLKKSNLVTQAKIEETRLSSIVDEVPFNIKLPHPLSKCYQNLLSDLFPEGEKSKVNT